MKLSFNKIFFILLVAQIISLQGIITFNIFNYLGKWELKSIIHPLSVFLLFIVIVLYRIKKNSVKITSLDLLLFSYFIICFIVLIFNAANFQAIFISFREVFLIYILIFAYQQITISEYYWDKIIKWLHLFVIANLIFIILTHVLGPEEYMKLLTGKYVWGNDPEYKFKISSFLYFWRSPGLIGSPGNVGYFGLIAYLLFDQDKKHKKKSIFAVILAIAGFVRSVYVVLVVYWFLKFFLTKKNLRKIQSAFPYVLLVFFLIGCFLYTKGLLDLTSFYMRIDHWIYDIPRDFNILFGGKIGEVGGSVRSEGFVATLDNYWLLMLLSVGLVGIVLGVLFIYEKSFKKRHINYALIGFMLAGIFITLSQGMSFLVLFPMLFLNKKN
ncbi:hypothetical protein FUA26_04185 [Seonamhaeicola algicola]|uniref:O-antigen ligase family protein n=1 Tax=Seonamhaeicola algicola TaxID=1719036 RepID=A0A5C7AWV4_9FLAO|nr:hypothetical protein [Seonamhaeicola algicola]TXE13001.1 hypothetical protein FUA26_04185 [Seonamhaeicola algicola]